MRILSFIVVIIPYFVLMRIIGDKESSINNNIPGTINNVAPAITNT